MPAAPASDALAEVGGAALDTLTGVGPALRAKLARLGLETVQDAWFHLPLRYEDRTRLTPIADLVPGQRQQLLGTVESVQQSFRGRPQLQIVIGDGSGSMLLRFFHFRRAQIAGLRAGTRLLCYGELRAGPRGLEMVHPQYRVLAAGAVPKLAEHLDPVYPVTEGLGQARLRRIIEAALARLPEDAELEILPDDLRSNKAQTSLRAALQYLHQPPADADCATLAAGHHPAQKRLAFEELLAQHLSLQRMRARVRAQTAPALASAGSMAARLVKQLDFALTAAQKRVCAEVRRDLADTAPMLRLVQGDVGSGKTVVAALAALDAIEAGHQVAMVAPTELLAEQHLRVMQTWLAPLDIEPVWLAGKVKGKARAQALAAVAAGAPLTIGTHALMQEGVRFASLGLVIIDEQHRFGVHQRLALSEKGAGIVPHQLVLTATPIPRTLAMSAYADLDVSTIDELPPGRTPVRTVLVASTRRNEVIERIRAACVAGRQAYWVCTLIEASDLLAAQAAEDAHAELVAALPGLSVGLIHGRMKPAGKQEAMAQFQRGETALLVATTVIEVGVDVPNASLMVIDNAERLGLSQLHQLRGRVGRGAVESSCVLLYQPPLSQAARERLAVMRETGDGFRIAEKDLELRGPGELLGTRQAGQLEFRVANWLRDADLLPEVHRVGAELLEHHPDVAEKIIARWFGSATRYRDA